MHTRSQNWYGQKILPCHQGSMAKIYSHCYFRELSRDKQCAALAWITTRHVIRLGRTPVVTCQQWTTLLIFSSNIIPTDWSKQTALKMKNENNYADPICTAIWYGQILSGCSLTLSCDYWISLYLNTLTATVNKWSLDCYTHCRLYTALRQLLCACVWYTI